MPGVSGVLLTPAPRTAPRGLDFRTLLQQLAPHAPARTNAPAPATTGQIVPSRQPAFHPGLTLPRSPVRQTAPTGRRAPQAAATPARHALTTAIRQASQSAGVRPELSVAVARVESNLDPRARSKDGKSVGTFQVTHATAAEMRRKIAHGTVARPPGTDDVALGVGYLRYLHDLFGRKAHLGRGIDTVPVSDPNERQLFAVAAFNAGEGSVARAQARAAASGGDPTHFADVRRFLPSITQGYVQRVSVYARASEPAATPA